MGLSNRLSSIISMERDVPHIASDVDKQSEAAAQVSPDGFSFDGSNTLQKVIMTNSRINRYTELSLERAEDGTWQTYVRYGIMNRSCKLPLISKGLTKRDACYQINDLLQKRLNSGYQITTIYQGSECVYRT